MTETEFKNNTKINEDGCWIWQGCLKTCSKGTHRYGWLRHNKRSMTAHRVSWLLYKGELSSCDVVCHKCDVPSCVNPEHLFVGSQKDNVKDMHEKNRARKGTAIRKNDGYPVRAKLSKSQIQEIKRLKLSGLSQNAISMMFHVCQATIGNVLSGRSSYAIE